MSMKVSVPIGPVPLPGIFGVDLGQSHDLVGVGLGIGLGLGLGLRG